MTDPPVGNWTELLVGHQWPSVASVNLTGAAAENRRTAADLLELYADSLRSAIDGPLASQEGVTAEDTREAFTNGESHALRLAEKNRGKGRAYQSANQDVSNLRTELSQIAADGNHQIEQILSSKEPTPIKLGKIVDVVLEAQERANAKATGHGANLLGAIQDVLDREGSGLTAREFATVNGVDLQDAWRASNRDTIRDRVAAMTNLKGTLPADNSSASSGSAEPSSPVGNAGTQVSGLPTRSAPGSLSSLAEQSQNTPSPLPTAVTVGTTAGSLDSVANKSTSTPASSASQSRFAPGSLASVSESAAPTSAAGSPAVQEGISPAPGGMASGSSSIGFNQSGASTPTAPTGMPIMPTTPTTALTPESLAQNFNTGAQAGTPMSAGTEALSTGAMHAMQPQAPLHTEPMAPSPMSSTAPSGGVPVVETANVATPVDTSPPLTSSPADATQTVVAAPAAPAAPVMPPPTAAAPVAPAGPLPAYGADLRPPAATAPVGPAPLPSATPGSAPVTPTNTSSLGQPAVVRQQPTPASMPTPAALTENAFAATATGAAAGAGAAQSQAQQRLQRLLAAVARQEPKLRWAIGEHSDGTTVLTTDIASGWIPPHIEIPTGVTLLPPRYRRTNLSTMLGEAALTAAYSPGQHLPEADHNEPASMSIRARTTPQVEELGWELSQATNWRDGLPRLAHTLAKAASTGTGYLDSEVELLREHLAAVTRQVLTDYPDNVDPAKVGNWQLLASIDALIKDEKTSANYHLAWFQTLSLAPRGEHRR